MLLVRGIIGCADLGQEEHGHQVAERWYGVGQAPDEEDESVLYNVGPLHLSEAQHGRLHQLVEDQRSDEDPVDQADVLDAKENLKVKKTPGYLLVRDSH